MARYKASYKGIGDMLCSKKMRLEMYNRAVRVKAVAEAIAPRGHEEDSPTYAKSFKASSGIREEPTRRAYGRVTNTDPKAMHLEFGTKHTPKFRTLGKAAQLGAGD